MNLTRWLSVILTLGLILAFNPLSVQADPYNHPHGNAYGWHKKHRGFDHYPRHFRPSCNGPHHPRHYAHYGGPPVAYLAPVAPVIGIPYSQPQPSYSQPAPPGLSGNLNWNF